MLKKLRATRRCGYARDACLATLSAAVGWLAFCPVMDCRFPAACPSSNSSTGGLEPTAWGLSEAGILGHESCAQEPAFNLTVLEEWGACTLLRDACLDQGRILLHSGEKTPGHPNWTAEPLFHPGQAQMALPITLPGYPEALGTSQYMPVARHWPDVRAPTPLDPPDVWRPQRFNNCTMPLIFWPRLFSAYADFYLARVVQLGLLEYLRAFDPGSVLFVVDSNGMALPPFYHLLLAPFARHKPVSLQAFSSRQRFARGHRCYSRLLLCRLEDIAVSGKANGFHKPAGRKIVEFYRQRHPEKFEAPTTADEAVFRVAFIERSGGLRRFLNLPQVLQQCRAWPLPPGSRFTSVECLVLGDFDPDNFVDSLALLQRVHALVGTHGAGLTNGFFLPSGSAMVEVLCSNFSCYSQWSDMYFRLLMEGDRNVATGYFRLVGDRQHCAPGPYEQNGTGDPVAYPRDQDIRVEFAALAKALAQIALGRVQSSQESWEERRIYMNREEPCPS